MIDIENGSLTMMKAQHTHTCQGRPSGVCVGVSIALGMWVCYRSRKSKEAGTEEGRWVG